MRKRTVARKSSKPQWYWTEVHHFQRLAKSKYTRKNVLIIDGIEVHFAGENSPTCDGFLLGYHFKEPDVHRNPALA